jgi:UDP-glucose 4-epimerase
MRVLITGGAGFIGSHLAGDLLDLGHAVDVIDDLSTGSMANVQHLTDNPNFSVDVDTIENVEKLNAMVGKADLVYHLAAAVGVQLVVERPLYTIEANIMGTKYVLEACAKDNTKVVIASTSEVFGKSLDVPFREDGDVLLGPTTCSRWSYAASKMVDEFLALAFHQERKLPAIVIRLFNTVGPKQTGRYGMVIPNFVRQALEGEELTVFGDGTQSRCFCHVEDVCRALVAIADKEEAIGEVYNLGTTEEVTINELANRVIALSDSSSKIKYVPFAEAYSADFEDIARRKPDNTKIRDLLGWNPENTLDQILTAVIDHERAVQPS